MKKHYEKPLVAIEYFELTQTIASCNIKIGFLDSACVRNDPDATSEMKNLAMQFYFASGTCAKSYGPGANPNDGVCYHTNLNAAFNS